MNVDKATQEWFNESLRKLEYDDGGATRPENIRRYRSLCLEMQRRLDKAAEEAQVEKNSQT